MAEGEEHLVDPSWWRGRQDHYLSAATGVFIARSPLNVIDHLEWSARSGHPSPATAIDSSVVDRWCQRIDNWLDCADFDLLRLLTIWCGYGDQLSPAVRAALRHRFLGFTYWYTDCRPRAGEPVDQRWYWSENHRLIFHTVEYLAGQELPGERFATTGLLGEEHRSRATHRLSRWFDDKSAHGFSEWHSDVYYAKDLAPLVTLAEFATDPQVAARATAFLDLLLTDMALHSLRDNMGCTHGRSYMRFKASATQQPVFGALKLCFDRTSEPWPLDEDDPDELLPLHESASLLARAGRYRPPAVVVRIARHDGVVVDRERMSIPIDPSEPRHDDPVHPRGWSYSDPEMVPFWWDRGALTPWQLVPLTLETIDRYQLWDAGLFAQIRTVRDAVGSDPDTLRELAAGLHPMVNAGLLSEVDTITWRSPHAMLSSAQAYRPGCAGHQHHVAQATLDEHAVVFTNHPGNEASAAAGDYRDDDRYWTGSATLPRSVQHDTTLIECYSPAFATPDLEALSGFAYLDLTHAYVPVEHFDQVEETGAWTVLRRRDGYVAIWSWRPTEWRDHDPSTTFTNGLQGRFDLVAPGGADNVWIIRVGDVDAWGSFERFREEVASCEVHVVDHGWTPTGEHRGFDVSCRSPSQGRFELDADGSMRIDGAPVPVGEHQRFENPFLRAPRGDTRLEIADERGGTSVDLATGGRRPSGPRRPDG